MVVAHPGSKRGAEGLVRSESGVDGAQGEAHDDVEAILQDVNDLLLFSRSDGWGAATGQFGKEGQKVADERAQLLGRGGPIDGADIAGGHRGEALADASLEQGHTGHVGAPQHV